MPFQIRTNCPSNNPYYIRQANGGYNGAIQGNPTKADANVLANCVGYANGRFAEIQDLGYIDYQLVCNARDFISRAQEMRLTVTDTPVVGAIVCWEGGSSGAGHVAVIEELYNPNHMLTSESFYRGNYFANVHRTNDNGRWGQNSNYRLLGFIINPLVATYCSHVQDYGWQEYVADGDASGTTGQCKQIEAIRVASKYIRYRVHMMDKGWSEWYTNNEMAGTVGENRRIEAIEFESDRELIAQAHCMDIGWQGERRGTHIIIGTTGECRRMEAFTLRFA